MTLSLPSLKQLLGGLSSAEFLAEYWQQQPLLIRDAWPGFISPVSPGELAGLACEEEVCGRLVRQINDHWQVQHGPFDETQFTRLPGTHWTLLIPDAEKYLSELADILTPFRFIADWRIDDLMISYAVPEGSVGPHQDAYDVFLLQGLGQRRWQISRQPHISRNDSELQLVKDFGPEQEWLLNPGDMLYLPPNTVHYGVAQGACMTYSIGFRAPDVQDLVADFCDQMIQHCKGQWHGAPPKPTRNPGQIEQATLSSVQKLLQQQFDTSTDTIAHWFGCYITAAKLDYTLAALAPPLTPESLGQALHQDWQRNPAVRFAYFPATDGAIHVYIHGQHYYLESAAAWLGILLCDHTRYSSCQLKPALTQPQAKQLLLKCINLAYIET